MGYLWLQTWKYCCYSFSSSWFLFINVHRAWNMDTNFLGLGKGSIKWNAPKIIMVTQSVTLVAIAIIIFPFFLHFFRVESRNCVVQIVKFLSLPTRTWLNFVCFFIFLFCINAWFSVPCAQFRLMIQFNFRPTFREMHHHFEIYSENPSSNYS